MLKSMFLIFKVVCALLVSVVILRLCFFDIYNVPSDSMLDALKRKDLIVINKTTYSGMLESVFARFKSNLKTNELVVFSRLMPEQSYFVKRCVGLPGDYIKIVNSQVIINSKLVREPLTVRHPYKIVYKNFIRLEQILKHLGINQFDFGYRRTPSFLNIELNNQQRVELGKLDNQDVIISNTMDGSNPASDSQIQGQHCLNNFSLLHIPHSGMKIALNDTTVTIYGKLLSDFENVKLTRIGSTFFINRSPAKYYSFINNYYFVLGDNRDNSEDSRYFGVIPEYNIMGKVILKIN